MIRKEEKKAKEFVIYFTHTQIYSQQNKEKVFMTITALLSVTGHMFHSWEPPTTHSVFSLPSANTLADMVLYMVG